MNMEHKLYGKAFVKRFYQDLLKTCDNQDIVILITPELYKLSEFKFEGVTATFVFIGFDVIEPLRLPNYSTLDGDVWVVNSVYRSANHTHITGDIFFFNSMFNLSNEHYQLQIDGIKTFDEGSWRNYQDEKAKKSYFENRLSLIVNKDKLTNQFNEVHDRVKKLNFSNYIDGMPGVQKLYSKNSTSHIIEGDVILHGPYPFDFEETTTIKGGLILLETFIQKYPVNFEVTGDIKVLSYY